MASTDMTDAMTRNYFGLLDRYVEQKKSLAEAKAEIERLQGLLDTLAGDPGSTEYRGWCDNRQGGGTESAG